MTKFLRQTDDILRSRVWGDSEQRVLRPVLSLTMMMVIFGLFYGAVMGTFAGVTGERFLQVVYSAVKVPLLLAVTFFVSVPSFFVLNTLLGVRHHFAQVLRALVATQAGLTIILASLAPVTVFWYMSSRHYQGAILFNGVMFGIASVAAQSMLRKYYRPLIEQNPVHRTLFRVWLVIFTFVGIQMGWVLRPFIGDPGAPTQFFRQEAWGNAYEHVARMIWKVLT